MNKALFEGYLNVIVDRNIKICNSVTKDDLIVGLFEQQNQNVNRNAHNPMKVTTMADMVSSAPKVDFTNSSGKVTPGQGFMDANVAGNHSEDIQSGKRSSLPGKKDEGKGSNYSQRLGMPAITFTSQKYNELSEAQLRGLSKLFTIEQIQKIYSISPNSWNTLQPKKIYTTEKSLTSGRTVSTPIKIYFDEAGQYFSKMPYGWVNSLYTRGDEGRVKKNAPISPDDNSKVVPMKSTIGQNQIKGLHLGDRWAIALTIPGETGSFLTSLEDGKFSAFFGV